jgi:LAS superfamily LD-carboxypeptidase LdcB
MSTSGGTPVRRPDNRDGRPRVSDDRLTRRPRQTRGRRRAVLLLVISLALLVALGLQISHIRADREVARQAAARQEATSQALAALAATEQVAADQAAAERAAADKALADQAAAEKAAEATTAAEKAATDKAAADQAAADIKAGKAAQPPPGMEGLQPALARAFTSARVAALAAGLDLRINSGFRTAATQQRLYDDAVAKYGSPAKARLWVLPPAESDHVKGLAIDVAPAAGASWLEKHGVSYGLCRRYVNEWWHFELLAPAAGQPCPAMEPYAGG